MAYLAVAGGSITTDFCARFVASWHEAPPGIETDLLVIANGGPLKTEQVLLFADLKPKLFIHSNEGWDLGAYVAAARGPCRDYDAVLWCGESNYFHRSGWLARLVEAWQRHGPGFYGVFASHNVRAHCATTAFFCSPSILRNYPIKIVTRQDRYEAEHGVGAFWRRTQQAAMPVYFVTWDGEWPAKQWRKPANILWRGDQSNCLFFCNHTDRYAAGDEKRKRNWAASADRAYQ